MNAFLGEADADSSLEKMQALASEGRIDAVTHLTPDRIYLFHGQADGTVARASMDALQQTYTLLGVPSEEIIYETEIAAGHGFVTESGKLDCGTTGPNFLIDCDFDQAGNILSHLYTSLAPPVEARDSGILPFSQTQYLQGAVGMDDSAFAYIPQTCAAGALCRLHIALHGCQQGREVIDDDFVRLSGYNRWAESNNIVVLYPQAQRIPSPMWNWFGGNPKGCWDWWGYAGDDYLSQDAPQIAAIGRMAATLGAPLEE